MNIEFFQKEIEELNFKTSRINENELYIESTKNLVKDLVIRLITEYKLHFTAEFCKEEEEFIISILFTDRNQGYFVFVNYKTIDDIISLQDIIVPSNLFEREISDLFGLKISLGSDTRNLVKHELWENVVYPLRKSFPHGKKIAISREVPEYKFKELSGEGGFQIPVGPIHAGIIEPGHFRFSVIGEQIENLEIRLMYKHRGIEKLSENMDANNLNLLFERVSGESSVAYSEAYALLIEKLTRMEISPEVKAVRVVLLELERIYNYLDDIGGMCVDIGFSYPAKKFAYFKELIHQLCERLTGSRFLRNSIIPFGINFAFTKESSKDIENTLENIKKRMNEIIEMTLDNVSFLDRVEHTGLVYNKKANALCLTGIVGRASGISYDVRTSFPYEIYGDIKKEVKSESVGGVFERYKLKVSEIRDAFDFISKALAYIVKDIPKFKKRIELIPNQEAVVAVETVKGELVVYGKTGEDNKFSRIYFKTPSFTNWNGLSYAVLNEIVPDFPLCNKSFNMSYSENDR